ncbi:hypothetical protein F5148DRAFT_1192110, partial [Russula earlei]
HPTLWRSLTLAGSPNKALLKAQEWRRRSRGQVAELVVRKSLSDVIFTPWHGRQMVHPDDLEMRKKILSELGLLDLSLVKVCHLENMVAHVASFLTAMSPCRSRLETLSVSQSSLGFDLPLRIPDQGLPSWENLRELKISNMECDWTTFTACLRACDSTMHFDMHFESIRSLLNANPTLEKLVVYTRTRNPLHSMTGVPPETLIMPYLRHFELSGVALSPHSIRTLSLPVIQVLRLISLPGPSMLQNFVEDPRTSLAELVELTIKNCAFQTQSLTLALFCSPKLEVLQLRSDFDANAVAESLSMPYSTLPPVLSSASRELVPTELPILCPSLNVLDLSGSPSLKTGPVMRVVKERLSLAASEDGGRYRLPGEDSDRHVSSIQALKIDECPHIEAEMLPWFRRNVPDFSCRYSTTTKERRAR